MNQVAPTARLDGERLPATAPESAAWWSHDVRLALRPAAAQGWLVIGRHFPREGVSTRATRPAERAITAVRSLSRYGAGWDGYGAAAPNQASIRDAVEFLSRTQYDREFKTVLGADGSVTLNVGHGDRAAHLTFEGDAEVSVSTKCAGFWNEVGVYPIRGKLGQTAPEVDQLLGAL